MYDTHLARPEDATDEERVRDVVVLQEFAAARANPSVITGDFNETIEFAPYVEATGKAGFVCAGGVIFYPIDREPADRDTLPPGRSFSALGFTCAADETRIRCTHDATRHGFAIAAEKNEQY